LGRTYIPKSDMNKYYLSTLSESETVENPEGFNGLIRYEIEKYREILAFASSGFHHINRRYRPSIQTASYMYEWTSNQIFRNPMIIWKDKVKPSKYLVVLHGIIYYFSSYI